MPGGQTYGRQLLSTTPQPVQVSADGAPEWKTGGITLDWSTVAAVGADTTLPDGLVIKNGFKGLRYGQVLTQIGVVQVQTITIDATAGTWTFTAVDPRTGLSVTSAPLGFAATAAAVQAEADKTFGLTASVVTLAGAVYTFTFGRGVPTVPTMTTDASLLTGNTHTAAVANTTAGLSNQAQWGPYDPAANDGRQTLARGGVGILNESALELGIIPPLGTGPTAHPGVIVGGRVFRSRLLATNGVHTLAAGPTFTELEAVMPRLSYAQI